MRLPKHTCIVGVAAVLTATLVARAQVKTTVERHQGPDATPEFKFKSIPAPCRGDAADRASWTIVDGDADDNGGGVEKLGDGRLPGEQDSPGENFFFAAGGAGGRLMLDLGGAVASPVASSGAFPIEVRQVNTYSWHADTRGPQVYKLYAADGQAQGFDARPKRDKDPEECGWKLIAAVDTRPKAGPPGGQYGVSISDASGSLGQYRYLLLDLSPTENDDAFGNTFYSEIDVISGATAAAQMTPALAVKSAAADRKYDIVIDYSEMPELKDWVETRLRPALEKWYPIIVDTLPSEAYTAPDHFTVTFRKNKRGVADTGGTHINCAGPWFKANLEGEAVGAVVHEMVHVVQQYGRARRGHSNPGWLVEGVADYIRWFKFEPVALRPRPNPARAKYTDSYRVTAAFLEYVAATKDHEIVVKLNAAMRESRYTPQLWEDYTGKTVDQLWDDYIAYLRKGSSQ
jgi:hypothetical protein